MKPRTFAGYFFLAYLTLLPVLLLAVAQPAIAQSEILDQAQTKREYGFWFDDDVIRWQEFIPTLNNVTAVEVFMYKVGNPGNVIVEIRTTDGTTLAQKTIVEANVPTSDWVRVEFSTPVSVSPGTKYRIYVYSDTDSPSTTNRYSWKGSNENPTYCPECKADVSGGWPDYDYAFKTYGAPLPLQKSVLPTEPIAYHGSVTYTLSLSNTGLLSDTATLTDTLPAGVAFGGWVNEPAGTIRNGGAITWTGTISTGEAVTLAFTATHTGDYGDTITNTAYFSGTDQTGSSAATFAVNRFPIADAGPDQTLVWGSLVQLDGSGSSDPDGHSLTYGWTQTGGAPQMTLSNNTAISPTFTATDTGVFTFTLTVTDPFSLTDTDEVVITVEEYYRLYLPVIWKQ